MDLFNYLCVNIFKSNYKCILECFIKKTKSCIKIVQCRSFNGFELYDRCNNNNILI